MVTQTDAPLTLEPAEQELLLEDVPAFARTVQDPAVREHGKGVIHACVVHRRGRPPGGRRRVEVDH